MKNKVKIFFEKHPTLFESIVEAILLIEITFILFVIYIAGFWSIITPILLGLLIIQVLILPAEETRKH